MIDLLEVFSSLLLRCRNHKLGPLITLRQGQKRTGAAAVTGTYCVCVHCGKEFAYDWEQMRMIDPNPGPVKLLVAKAAGKSS